MVIPVIRASPVTLVGTEYKDRKGHQVLLDLRVLLVYPDILDTAEGQEMM